MTKKLTLRNNKEIIIEENSDEVEAQKRVLSEKFVFHLAENGRQLFIKRRDILMMEDIT